MTGGPGAAAVDGGPGSRGEGGGMAMLWGLLCGCVSRYMGLFSAKLCCFTDLRPHLALFVMAGEQNTRNEANSSKYYVHIYIQQSVGVMYMTR